MAILRLDDVSDERLDVFTNLTNHQLRNALDPARGTLIAESEIAIRVALAHGVKPLAFLLDERKLASMADVLGSMDNVPAFVLPPEQAQKLTGYRVTRGALCAMRRPVPPPACELVRTATRLVVLEGITDTSNVGAIFRNAAALGADAVVVAPSCADPFSRRAVRVSMGNVFLVPWARAEKDWPDALFRDLRGEGFTCLSLALEEDACKLGNPRLRDFSRVALFFGAEGSGLTAEVLEGCDRSVIIPMSHGVDSLNVAASSAIALWELFARSAG